MINILLWLFSRILRVEFSHNKIMSSTFLKLFQSFDWCEERRDENSLTNKRWLILLARVYKCWNILRLNHKNVNSNIENSENGKKSNLFYCCIAYRWFAHDINIHLSWENVIEEWKCIVSNCFILETIQWFNCYCMQKSRKKKDKNKNIKKVHNNDFYQFKTSMFLRLAFRVQIK